MMNPVALRDRPAAFAGGQALECLGLLMITELGLAARTWRLACGLPLGLRRLV